MFWNSFVIKVPRNKVFLLYFKRHGKRFFLTELDAFFQILGPTGIGWVPETFMRIIQSRGLMAPSFPLGTQLGPVSTRQRRSL